MFRKQLDLPAKKFKHFKQLVVMSRYTGETFESAVVEKPKHVVIGTYSGFEERVYTPALWVSTIIRGSSHEKARSEAFGRLFSYISGNNEKGKKIEMTAPVITRVIPGDGISSFTVSFYLPQKHLQNPVQPASRDLFLEKFPEMTVFASHFGGFANDTQFREETQKLMQKVGRSVVNTDFYFTAGYDSPYKMVNRRNEVWLLKR